MEQEQGSASEAKIPTSTGYIEKYFEIVQAHDTTRTSEFIDTVMSDLQSPDKNIQEAAGKALERLVNTRIEPKFQEVSGVTGFKVGLIVERITNPSIDPDVERLRRESKMQLRLYLREGIKNF